MRKPVEKGSDKIELYEKVVDPNGRNVFVKSINLKSINGDTFDQKNPDWINWKTINDKINNEGSRVKRISLEIKKSRLNENVNYVFELISSNGRKESRKNITISVSSTIQKEFNILVGIKSSLLSDKIELLYFPVYKKVSKKGHLRKSKNFIFNRKQNQFSYVSPNIILKKVNE